MKKFLKKTEGFTLVELIVVIAILGILTAVAVPAYSGYVKKASEAGDTQTLSAINTAVAAALTENNVEYTKANVEKYLSITDDNNGTTAGCNVTIDDKSTFAGVTGTDAIAAETALSTSILGDFQTYYGKTGTIKFEYYNGIAIPDGATNGSFQGTPPTT